MINESIRFILASEDFVEIQPGPLWNLDLRYASTNNFVGLNMYGAFNRAFLHRISAEMLHKAADLLQSRKTGYRFLIYDALRPRSVQRVLWNYVVGTSGEKYIANPERGSLHNFGFAVDLTVLDEKQQPLDMGADYDDFREIAQPQLEDQFYRSGALSSQQLSNRHLLRDVMQDVGFEQLAHEWWHFDALSREEVQSRFTLVE